MCFYWVDTGRFTYSTGYTEYLLSLAIGNGSYGYQGRFKPRSTATFFITISNHGVTMNAFPYLLNRSYEESKQI